MVTHEERIIELERRQEIHFKKFDIAVQERVALDTKHLLWEALLEERLKSIFDLNLIVWCHDIEVKMTELEKLELKVWCYDIDRFIKTSRKVLYAIGIGAILTFVGAILAFIFAGGLHVN